MVIVKDWVLCVSVQGYSICFILALIMMIPSTIASSSISIQCQYLQLQPVQQPVPSTCSISSGGQCSGAGTADTKILRWSEPRSEE